MKKIYLFILFASLVSCGKFLEPKSPSEFVPKNVNSLNELLTNEAYYQIHADNKCYFTFLEVFNDDAEMTSENAYFSGLGTADREDGCMKLVAMTGDVFASEFTFGQTIHPWECFYESILRCNAVLDYLSIVSGSESEKAYVEAQALFLRALGYFYLVNYYGAPYGHDKNALGVPLKLNSDLVIDGLVRNSVEEVYNQIVKDLLRAEKCWELAPAKQFRKDFRANLPATQHLLSRVYLYMENWTEAIRYAEKVIGWSNFSLYDLNTFVGGAEPLVNYATYGNSETIWAYGSVGDFTKIMSASFDLKKEVETESLRLRRVFVTSKSLLNCYADNGSDLRRDLYIFREWITDTGNSHLSDTKIPVGKISHNLNMQPLSGESRPAFTFRLSETYLILAESYAMMGGEDGKALSYINMLREKRIKVANYVKLQGITGDNLVELIRLERRRELCFEGGRWFDQRRWGMKSFKREWRKYGEVAATYTISDNDNAFVFPIPQNTMVENPSLKQNPLSTRTIY